MPRTHLRWESSSALVRPQPPAALPAFIQAAAANSGAAQVASQDVTLSTPATAGSLLVACGNSDATLTTPSGFTLGPNVVYAAGCYLWYKIAAGGETTVTLTPSVNRTVAGSVLEYSGIAPSSPLDATATASNTGASTTGPVTAGATGTTAQAVELVVAITAPHSFPDSAGPNSPSWTNGYVNRASTATSFATGGQNCALFVAELVVSSVGAQSTSTSWTNSAQDWAAIVATFKGA